MNTYGNKELGKFGMPKHLWYETGDSENCLMQSDAVPACFFAVWRSRSAQVFSLCSRLTLKLGHGRSAWCKWNVAFFMFANWIILTGFEVKENILENQLISCCTNLLILQTVIKDAGQRLDEIFRPSVWRAQILTPGETSAFDMSICAFGLRPVNMMHADSPNWAYLRFIGHKLGICHLWSAITVACWGGGILWIQYFTAPPTRALVKHHR